MATPPGADRQRPETLCPREPKSLCGRRAQQPRHESGAPDREPVGTRSGAGTDGGGGGGGPGKAGPAPDTDQTLLGHAQVALAGRISSAGPNQSWGRSESGALGLQLETGAGGGGTGKTAGGAGDCRPQSTGAEKTARAVAVRAWWWPCARVGVPDGEAVAGAEGSPNKLFRSCLNRYSVFHTGSSRRFTGQRPAAFFSPQNVRTLKRRERRAPSA